MATLTLEEARNAAILAHPDWRAGDIDHLAKGMVAKSEKLALEDRLADEVAALQAKADADNAEQAGTGLAGHVGGAASVWDAFRQGREDALWSDLEERSKAHNAKLEEQDAKNGKPEGWSY